MPIYEYKCDKCNLVKEATHKMNEKPIIKCDKCHKKMRRIFSVAGIKFVGPGFYTNDYKDLKKVHPEAVEAHEKGII